MSDVVVVVVDDDDDDDEMMMMMMMMMLLLLLLLLFQVKYFRPKTSKNTVFSDIFMSLEEQHTGFYAVFERQGRKSPKNIASCTVFLANA